MVLKKLINGIKKTYEVKLIVEQKGSYKVARYKKFEVKGGEEK